MSKFITGKKFKFTLIGAMAKGSRGIGIQNRLPWKIKEDIQWFRCVTNAKYEKCKDGNTVVMGRNTWESIPKNFKPLPGRRNVVLSAKKFHPRDQDALYTFTEDEDNPEVLWANNINVLCDEKFDGYKNFVIGGQQIYEQAIQMEECEEIFLTEVDEEVFREKEGEEPKSIEYDSFFPKIPKHFRKTFEAQGETPGVTFQVWNNWSDPKSPEKQYINMLKEISSKGEKIEGRNGTVISKFGDYQHVFDLQHGFPLLTTKRMPMKTILKELLFFIRGDTNSKILSEDGVHIWDGNTTREFLDNRGLNDYEEGDMGPMYGWNWRHFGAQYIGCDFDYASSGYDQLHHLIDNITNNPQSRRLLLTTYDPSKVKESVLAPCHGLTVQFNVRDNKFLDCKMYQRSVDVALGYPFNIASYAAFVHILSAATGYLPGKLFMTLGDTHIYEQHLEKVKRHFDRHTLKFPTLSITKDFNPDGASTVERLRWIEGLVHSDFELNDYHYYPGIKMNMVA